jgi:hypothetical protein
VLVFDVLEVHVDYDVRIKHDAYKKNCEHKQQNEVDLVPKSFKEFSKFKMINSKTVHIDVHSNAQVKMTLHHQFLAHFLYVSEILFALYPNSYSSYSIVLPESNRHFVKQHVHKKSYYQQYL